MGTVEVYALPSQVEPNELIGATVVVIDVIRASTTIISALAAGAAEVRPFLEVDDARAAAKILDAQQGREAYLLGGERDAVVIDGFDLGNSPSDYTKERVARRTMLFTTTNGTRAMMRCRAAQQVFIGAFVNVGAVAERLLMWQDKLSPHLAGTKSLACKETGQIPIPFAPPCNTMQTGDGSVYIARATIDQKRIVLLCAGTAGEESGDDLLLAGLLVDRLQCQAQERFLLNDQAAETRAAWQTVAEQGTATEQLAKQLAKTLGGRNVVRAGLASDLLDVAAVDRFSIVPELDIESMRIRLS